MLLTADQLQTVLSRRRRECAADRARRYHRARALLIAQLGGTCMECGATPSLEFHHLLGLDWQPRRTARWVRLARYRREAALGLVVLLCRRCNAEEGNPVC